MVGISFEPKKPASKGNVHFAEPMERLEEHFAGLPTSDALLRPACGCIFLNGLVRGVVVEEAGINRMVTWHAGRDKENPEVAEEEICGDELDDRLRFGGRRRKKFSRRLQFPVTLYHTHPRRCIW
jgi:hypothetical protein